MTTKIHQDARVCFEVNPKPLYTSNMKKSKIRDEYRMAHSVIVSKF